MPKNKSNQKTTCNKKQFEPLLPPPPANVVAAIVGVSTDYVKKINSGHRVANTDKGNLVKMCNELIIDGQKELIRAVTEIINAKQNPQA